MAWRVAHSLDLLLSEINAKAPNRDKSADGGIGNAAHAATASDHNPNSAGVVTARDYTHDPHGGFDSYAFAEWERKRRDKRIKYIISNGRIFGDENYARRNGATAWEWARYTGPNPHNHHVHVSVNAANADDVTPWGVASVHFPPVSVVEKPKPMRPTIRKGSVGDIVRYLQARIGTSVDGQFGPKTEAALKAFQTKHGLVADGICGPYSWEKVG